MDRNIFRYILRHSARAQLLILAMTVASFPFLYATLELPKLIINDALSGDATRTAPSAIAFTQIEYLFLLCGVFLVLVLINGGFKYVINVYQGIVGERMLRRLRYELFSRVLRFPLPHFRHISPGEIVQMITAEVEPIGGFIGDAFALPAFQGGTLLTILVFMFVQDPIMGLAAIALYPIQIYVIPKLQRQVNALGKPRVRQVRRLSDRIGETVGGVRDIRANDTTQYERARFSEELGVDLRHPLQDLQEEVLHQVPQQLPGAARAVLLLLDRRLPRDHGRTHARRAGRGGRRAQGAVLALEGAARPTIS